MVGRPGCCPPVWIKVTAGSWLMASVCIERMMARSSAMPAMCGSSSDISAPDRPCFPNWNLDPTHTSLRPAS